MKPDDAKAWLGVASTLLPLAEKYAVNVLPVGARVRDDALPAAVISALLAAAAGFATARNTRFGLLIGWTSLALFVCVMVVLFGFIDVWPRLEEPLYVVFFLLTALSASSFLSLR